MLASWVKTLYWLNVLCLKANRKQSSALKLRCEIEAKDEFKRLQANICLQDVSIKEDLLDR